MESYYFRSTMHRLNQVQVNLFANASSGTGKIHTDPAYASRTPFGKPLVHGLYLLAFIEKELTKQFEGWNQYGLLEITFLKPVKVDDTFEICFESIEGKDEISISVIRDEEKVIVGTAKVKGPIIIDR